MRQSAAITGTLLLVFVFSAAGMADGGVAAPVTPAPQPAAVATTVPSATSEMRDAALNVDVEVASALEALAPFVRSSSHPEALATAFRAYFSYREANPERVDKPYFYFVDYGLRNTTPRGYVFDMESLTLVEGPFTVAHGRGSSRSRNGVPTSFSNRPGSASTSLGLYLTQETYDFSGTANGRRYTSIGLRLQGVSGGFNDAARRRGVVAHGAPYVSARDAGRSEGCPALEQARARRLLPMIANGSLVFLYSPNDPVWLEQDPWL